MKIKVMIVDDQSILSEGIKSVLSTSDDLEVVGVACDGRDALEWRKISPTSCCWISVCRT